MNLEKKETFFTLGGGCDRKNKLLRSNARLTNDEIERIDSGTLTIEDLNTLLSKRARIFKYQTQITIHAQFPREFENRVNGYAHLTNNKNGSVGVRYGAIDEVKREYLQRYLSYEGFRYYKNSTEYDFLHTKAFTNRDEAISYIEELKAKYDYHAVKSLMNGGFQILGGYHWGRYYVILKLTINTIPNENRPQLLKLMRCKTDAEIEIIENEERKEQEERERKYEQERKERQAGEAEDAKTKRQEILSTMRKEHTQINQRPKGKCSICLVTDKANLIVIKQFHLKNGSFKIKKFFQREFGLKDYQKWNDMMPSHLAKDTCRIDDATIDRLIAEGCAFTF